MGAMTGFEHLLNSYDVGDLLDEIASSDPPAYLHRCFAECLSTPALSAPRVQQLAVCGVVLDSVMNDRAYEGMEPELIGDWRIHYGPRCAQMKDLGLAAIRRGLDYLRTRDPESAAELEALERRLAPA
jgi:hypothetical protein